MVKEPHNKFAGAYLEKVQFELEPTSFDAEDMRTCFGIKAEGRCQKRPEFRLIALQGAGTVDDEDVKASVGVSLLCRACATEVARETLAEIEGLRKSDVPTLGFMFLPMQFEPKLAEMLKGNVTPEVWTDPVNRRSSYVVSKRRRR